jgi:cytochrome c oxidase cbb3-type subunit 2
MKFKAFIIGLLVSFGLPWLLAVVIPYSKMRALEPVSYSGMDVDGGEGVYLTARDGRIREGSQIYGAEGCYHCHSQLIRPTTDYEDIWRTDWAGLTKTADRPDTRRETLPTDYQDEQIAHIGLMRVGPDLSNIGRRITAKENVTHLRKMGLTPETWLFAHLYDPRGLDGFRAGNQDVEDRSSCPSKRGLFKKVSVNQGRADALPVETDDGTVIIPTDRARQLVGYLLSLKKDNFGQPLPQSLNFNPTAQEAK